MKHYSKDEEIIAQLIGSLASRYFDPKKYIHTFRVWEEREVHITPVHYDYPIPDTRTLSELIWAKKSNLTGINLNDEQQIELLTKVFPKFKAEYNQFHNSPNEPGEFHFHNDMFDAIDALTLYCMIRHYKPRTIIEVGSGFSTRLAMQALLQNGDGKVICIEPFPDPILKQNLNDISTLITQKVEDVDRQFFDILEANDILFIDSSHIVKIGGDVNFLFLEVIPILKPGVIIHVHDVFFPNEYPREWVMDRLNFWTEQYLLQAFLSYNEQFEILLCNSYAGSKYPQLVKETFPDSPWWSGSSFWFRRKLQEYQR